MTTTQTGKAMSWAEFRAKQAARSGQVPAEPKKPDASTPAPAAAPADAWQALRAKRG